MADTDGHPIELPRDARTVVINLPRRRVWPWVVIAGLAVLTAIAVPIALAVGLASAVDEVGSPFAKTEGIGQVAIEGPPNGPAIAVIDMTGTIGPPFTDDWIAQIEEATEDDEVAAVLLHVDSPGGLVADSHQIFHRLQTLSERKPMAVQFGRLAASGGYYVAMGAGPDAEIVAEPTTWTGSIGVIVPAYNVTDLADKVGIEATPLKTGRFKDTLSPFRDLTDDEREVWDEILDDAFERFKDVIAYGRDGLERAEIDAAATGQIFTAEQAVDRGLVDRIGYRDETLDRLAERAELSGPRVFRYESPSSPLSLLLGSADAGGSGAMASDPAAIALRLARPEAYYLFGWPTTLLPR